MSSDPQLRLTVYRQATGRLRWRWPGQTEGERLSPQRAESREWHEESYSWELGGGEQVVAALSSVLVEEFHEGLAPERRRPRHLYEVVAALRAGEKGLEAEWSASQEPNQAADEMPPRMVNVPLALMEHLRWIAETFEHLPEAHIVVR